jgi:hypothetical protein
MCEMAVVLEIVESRVEGLKAEKTCGMQVGRCVCKEMRSEEVEEKKEEEEGGWERLIWIAVSGSGSHLAAVGDCW